MQEFINPNNLKAGTVIGGSYEVGAEISKSTESTVYAARHLVLSRDVVVKVLNLAESTQDEKRRARFGQEARLAISLDHANIVKTLAGGLLDDGRPYIVMELIDGVTLREELNRCNCISVESFKEIFCQVLSGLDYVHSSGLLHRDIKPENILLATGSDGFRIAKLSDFGIAKSVNDDSDSQSLTGTKDLMGSPAYMSPEQCQNLKLDERSDIYSLGCTMFEALSGKTPFVSDSTFDLMYKRVHEKTPKLRSLKIRADLVSVIEKCLRRNPEERWSSAAELKSALEKIHTGSERSPWQAALAILAIFTILVFSVWLLIGYQAKEIKNAGNISKPIKRKAGSDSVDSVSFEDFERTMARADYPQAFRILTLLSQNKNISDQSHLHSCFAYYYKTLSDYTSSLEHARLASVLALKQASSKDDFAYENSRLEMAVAYMNTREFDKAKAILKELISSLNSLTDHREANRIYMNYCDYLCRVKNYSEVNSLTKKLRRGGKLTQEESTRLRFYQMLSAALRNDRKALDELCHNICQEIDAIPGPIEKCSYLSLVPEPYLLIADWKTARRFLIESSRGAQIYDKENNSNYQIRSLQQRAIVDLALGHMKTARTEFTQVEKMQEKIGHRQMLPTYFGLAWAAYQTSDLSSAHLFVKKALSLPATDWIWSEPCLQSVDVELSLARRLFEEGNNQGAERLLKQANSLPVHTAEQRKQAQELAESLQQP